MAQRTGMIVTGYDILALPGSKTHEIKLHLVVDDPEAEQPYQGTHEVILQVDQMVEYLLHIGFVRFGKLFQSAGCDLNEMLITSCDDEASAAGYGRKE